MADAKKGSSFLSSLKAGGKPGGGLGGLGGMGGGGGAPEGAELVRPLQRRIDELEKKLQEVLKASAPPEEGEPPRPPTELMMYIHARTELLERKLQEAQAEALRANLLLHEREAAQREAQKEVEQMFRSIQDQTRAVRYDAALREQIGSAQKKVEDLQTQLQEAKLRAMPVEDVARALRDNETMEVLRQEVADRVRKLREREGAAQPSVQTPDAAPETPGMPPLPQLAPPAPKAGPATQAHDIASDTGTVLLLTAKIAELEHSLEQVRNERDEEKRRRVEWERDIVANFAQADARWKKHGGAEVAVEAALETMALALRDRDAAEAELKDALDQAQAQPPGADPDPVLRSRITAAQERLERLQETLQKQLNLVQAWIAQSR
ncbi:MAG: hypothetical protein HY925_04115 [Elusimicrobia bacterium]|nr:hypothetical protein [Elusimicrobiota bacterium]